MIPRLLLVYSSALFARGLVRLLVDRDDCAVAGTLSVQELSAERLAQTGASVVILEGDDADPATGTAIRLLQGWGAPFVLIRVNLGAPRLYVYRCDRPVPAGLDELTGIIHRLADQPAASITEIRAPEVPA